jgi:hypothetical protein
VLPRALDALSGAVAPGMATVPGSLLLCISSPYARRGALWKAYRDHFGQDADPILVWQADTHAMNPTEPEHVIADAYAEDERFDHRRRVTLLATDGRRRGLGLRSDVGEIRVVPADRGLDLPTARDVRIRRF